MHICVLAKRDPYTDAFLDRFPGMTSDHITRWIPGEPPPDTGAEVLLSMTEVSRAMLESLPNLALVQTVSTGYEGVDIDSATELGIWVSYAPSFETGNADSVAEHAIMLMLGVSRQIHVAQAYLRNHRLARPINDLALKGKSVCIIGLGAIGMRLATLLRPFGVELRAVDRRPERAPADIPTRPFADLLASVSDADYVVLCVRADRQNQHLIDKEVLATMRSGSILINIARGSLVDEVALVFALRSGHLAGAGLDVLEREPADPSNPLLALPNAFVTPHLAGFTDLNFTGTVAYMAKVVEQFRAGERISSLINAPLMPRRALVADGLSVLP